MEKGLMSNLTTAEKSKDHRLLRYAAASRLFPYSLDFGVSRGFSLAGLVTHRAACLAGGLA
jgi:hypothetical protein